MRKKFQNEVCPTSFSKYNETCQKLVYSQETSVTVMHAKFPLISMQNAKVLNQDR